MKYFAVIALACMALVGCGGGGGPEPTRPAFPNGFWSNEVPVTNAQATERATVGVKADPPGYGLDSTTILQIEGNKLVLYAAFRRTDSNCGANCSTWGTYRGVIDASGNVEQPITSGGGGLLSTYYSNILITGDATTGMIVHFTHTDGVQTVISYEFKGSYRNDAVIQVLNLPNSEDLTTDSIAGLWNDTQVDPVLGEDVLYFQIFADGRIVHYDYQQDEYDDGDDCYIVENNGFTLTPIGGDLYRSENPDKPDETQTITITRSNNILTASYIDDFDENDNGDTTEIITWAYPLLTGVDPTSNVCS